MGQLTAQRIFNGIKGILSALDATDEALIKSALWRDKAEAHVTDGGTAGTAQTETFVWRNDTGADVLVVGAKICTPVGVTANDTNNATVTLSKRSSSGGSQATVGALTTNTAQGSITAFLPVALTLTAANVVVASGEVLTIAVSKAGTGVAIAAATSQARVEIILDKI